MAIIQMSEDFAKAANNLPKNAKAKLTKIFMLLTQDPRHPSLQVKKIKGSKRADIYECRLDQGLRIILRDLGDATYALVHVGAHDATLKHGAALGATGAGFGNTISVIIGSVIANLSYAVRWKRCSTNNAYAQDNKLSEYLEGDESSINFVAFNIDILE